ncbi:MAG: glycosyl hydrolase family 32 [Planctomycetes bacterium]|nr:glycosyl hydrolase family 32 [Planctomycetota bacterium]
MQVRHCHIRFVVACLLCLLACFYHRCAIAAQPEGERESASGKVSYNGIVLPDEWPPRMAQLPRDPSQPPYLESPPNVIPIDIGRQLFVDDFLVEHTTLTRTFHQAEYYEHNPILKPDQPWETNTAPNPCAMVFSDGVWYDPQDKLFKMWYMGGYVAGTCYATSTDGIRWEKPELDVVPGTNLVQQGRRDSSVVWLDHTTTNPQARFKLAYYASGGLLLCTSADGIHWSEPARSGRTGDRTSFFYNPFLKRWIYSIRTGVSGFGRSRLYWEAADFLEDANWKSGEPVLWTSADSADPKREDLGTPPQLYNLDCVAYESLLLGLFTIWRGQPSDRAKPNEVCLGFSRDGFHWDRPDRRAFIPVSETHGDWNWGNVQSAGGGCLVVGEKLYFYVSGRAGVPGSRSSGVCSTGLATVRRDGFASLDAAEAEGTLTTRPVRFQGKYLFVNADVDEGELRVEVLDEDQRVIAPFSLENCVPLSKDSTIVQVRWTGAKDLSKLAGKTVRFRFYVKRGSLFSFWVSPDASGASYGYVAAGGPEFDGPVDTVGRETAEE